MRFIVYLIAGVLGGFLGGMGMGGGTVLIPILTIFCGVEQHLAQSVNLLSFLPMALLSLRVHSQNGLLDTKGVLWRDLCERGFGRRSENVVRRVFMRAFRLAVLYGRQGRAC